MSPFIKNFLISCIIVIRPLLGPFGFCLYPVSCTEFAQQQLRNQPLHKALWHIAWRLIYCNPLTFLWRRATRR